MPRSDSWNQAGQRRAEVVVVARHERRDDDGALGGDRLDVLEGHVADELGLGEVAGGGEPLAELPGGAARELLHPAHPQPQRLAEDAVVAAALARPARVGMCSAIASAGSTGRRGHLRRGEREHGRAAGEDLLVVRPSWRASASTRSATDAPVIRLPPVSVSMPMRISWACSARRIGPAAVQQRDQLPAGQLVQRRHGLEVGVGAVEEVLGQAGQRGPQPPDPPRAAQAGGRPGPG